MIRILVINWQDITHPQGGGAEVHLHEIFKRVVQRGHRVTLLCCAHEGARPEEEIDGIRIIRRGSRALFNFFVPFQYRRLIRQHQFDVVFDDINKIPFFTPLFVKKPLIGIIHHLFGKSIFQETSFLPASYVYNSEKLIPRIYRNTPLSVVSPSSKEELLRKGMREELFEIIYNGVDCQLYRPGLKPKSKTPLIGYLGRIKRYKSVEHVISAFVLVRQDIPDARLQIVGDGDHLPALKAQVKSLDLTREVEFTGFVSEEDKINYLNRMWVCVNPSPKEGWGVSVIEANACGTPVIAADSPGLRDSVVDQETGLLYPYGDVEMLARHLEEMLRNQSQRVLLSQNARKWAENYDWEKSAELTVSLIENTIIEFENRT